MIGNKTQILEYLDKDKEGDIYDITRKQEKTIRSLAQNSYYHGIICKVISDWSGDSTIGVHYMIKQMFKLKTTTDLATDEFAFMCKSIIELFKENYGVIIPTPSNAGDNESLYKTLGF